MESFESEEQELLKKVLEPLLTDFQHWFSRTRQLLEDENISFLTPDEQGDLLQRVKQAQQEVDTAKMMFHATEGQVGVEMSTVIPWHELLAQCWKISFQWRSLKKENLAN
jgi:hypothetical protein